MLIFPFNSAPFGACGRTARLVWCGQLGQLKTDQLPVSAPGDSLANRGPLGRRHRVSDEGQLTTETLLSFVMNQLESV
jgi:hypothetical protein